MGKSDKRKNRSVSQAADANPAASVSGTRQVSRILLTENLHDYAKKDDESDEFLLCEEEFPTLVGYTLQVSCC